MLSYVCFGCNSRIWTHKFHREGVAQNPVVIGFNDESCVGVANDLLLQPSVVLKEASKSVLKLFARHPIVTYQVLPEVSFASNKDVAMCKLRRCKSLYCYTLVVVAIAEAPLLPPCVCGCYKLSPILPPKWFGCYMWFPLLPLKCIGCYMWYPLLPRNGFRCYRWCPLLPPVLFGC